MSPRSKYWGDVSPLSHVDRHPWWTLCSSSSSSSSGLVCNGDGPYGRALQTKAKIYDDADDDCAVRAAGTM